jgi:hypothetical protein
MKSKIMTFLSEILADLKGSSIKDKFRSLYYILDPFNIPYYPPSAIKFIGKYTTKDNKFWLLFSNNGTMHQPDYVTYFEEKDGSISITMKRDNFNTTIPKQKKPTGAYKVFTLLAWEDMNNEPIDLEREGLNQDAFKFCNWFCEYPFPDKPIPTLKFRL